MLVARDRKGTVGSDRGAPSEAGTGENPVWKLVEIMIDEAAAFRSDSELTPLARLEANERGLRVSTKTLRNYNPMKTISPSLKFFRPAMVATIAIVIACGLSAQLAQAGYILTLQQVGLNVLATGSGPIDLTGLTGGSSVAVDPRITGSSAFIRTGAFGSTADSYTGFTGPTNFGSGFGTSASSGSGNPVGVAGQAGFILVPKGYVSDNALSDTSIYNNTTLSSLGVTPGTYVWSWGTGLDQKFTLEVRAAAVPDSGSTFGLLFLSLIGLFGLNRLRHVQLA